ncbi:MAG: 3,4-dihydroxy-2-butanone-4-phosphate synthase [Alphaproteobacteria bacterium]
MKQPGNILSRTSDRSAGPLADDNHGYISSAEEIIAEARKGRMFILVDDEDRENEGDLVIPAEMANAEVINFMAKHGRGLVCLAMDRQKVEALGLPLMQRTNGERLSTAFTVSIEARHGVTTGISAADRARTIAAAIDPKSGPADIVTPGHIFPLLARDGGVLERAGHTEAAVDVARLAGLAPAGVICEIMNDDGTMARLPDLVPFAQFHGLKIGTIADMIAYRKRTESLVAREQSMPLDSIFGGSWNLTVYRNTISGLRHVSLVKGEIDPARPVLVRMHALHGLQEVLGDVASGRAGDLHSAMRMIGEAGTGCVVLINDGETDLIAGLIRAHATGTPPVDGELRDYGIGAQILRDLGVREMILLSRSDRTVVGLQGYDLSIVERRDIR